MDKESILMAMNHIDETLVAEAASVQQGRRRTSWKRAALIAACLCMIFTVSVAALIGSGVLLRFLHDNKYVGLTQVRTEDPTVALYGAESTVRISVDELSDEVRKLATEQDEEEEYYLFSSWIAMEMFLDMDIAYNPVLIIRDRAKQSIPGSALDDENINYGLLRVAKDLGNIRMHEIYLNDDFVVQVIASVTTDAVQHEQTDEEAVFNGMFHAYTEKELENLVVEEYTMANGCTATIIGKLGLGYDPIRTYSAFFNTEKALIGVHVDCGMGNLGNGELTQDEIDACNEATLAELKLVLDGFQ